MLFLTRSMPGGSTAGVTSRVTAVKSVEAALTADNNFLENIHE